MSTFTGDVIRKYRIQKGLTQKQLGELCGMADSTIRRYELGLQNPKIETLEKIASALDVSVYALRVRQLPDIDEVREQMERWGLEELLPRSGEERILMDKCRELNEEGRKEAVKRIDELTFLEKYTK